VLGWLEIEHIVPNARGGTDDEDNLWLACRLCNNFKNNQTHGLDKQTGELVAIFNPRSQVWSDHFEWSIDGSQVIGRTATGRASVAVLRLNNAIAVTVRKEWVVAGWHPPHLP
jgi:hypothetical protein